MSEAYAVWDVTVGKATDASDGLPDRAIVSLVEQLRAAGWVTYQSCAGHFGESEGTLWINAGPPVDWAGWQDLSSQPFTRIQHVYLGPEGDRLWEWWWDSFDAARVFDAIRGIYLR